MKDTALKVNRQQIIYNSQDLGQTELSAGDRWYVNTNMSATKRGEGKKDQCYLAVHDGPRDHRRFKRLRQIMQVKYHFS